MPGDTIRFTIYGALTAATNALSETADPSRAPMTKTGKEVSLVEYGKLITTTQKLRTLSFANIDLDAGTLVGDNMGKSVDLIARAAFNAQTGAAYIEYGSGEVNPTGVSQDANHYLKGADIRYAFNRLERGDVPMMANGFYVSVLHPDVVKDLRDESGAGAWRVPREYVDPAEIYNGEFGAFEGFRFVVSNHASIITDGGTGTTDLYMSYFIGYQSVAYGEGLPPAMGISGPFDAMQRLMNVYWYGLFGFGELRPESLFKFYTSSSLGA
jgi:N4-gp56 family major capsid protein